MSVRQWVFLFFFSVFVVLANLANAVECKVLNGTKKELDAGSNFNILIKITNASDSVQNLRISLNTKGTQFKTLSDYSSLLIAKNAVVNKIISVQVPTNCASGNYVMSVRVIDNASNTELGLFDIPVVVNPRFEIEIIKGNTPAFLLSGDSLTLNTTIRNLSNQDVTVKASAVDAGSAKNELIRIPQGETAIFRYFSTMPKDITSFTRRLVVVSASIQEKEEVGKTTSYSFDVFPGKESKFDKYNRLPIRIGATMLATNRWGGLRSSSLYDISGNGLFGINKDRQFNFSIRGPDRKGDPLLGMEEQYNVQYITPKMKVSIGDDYFGLSELTESSRGGRGIQALVMPGKWTLGGFYNIPKYYPLIKNTFSVYGAYDLNPRNYLKVGLLSKVDTLDKYVSTYMISTHIAPLTWLNSSFEYALGQDLNSYSSAYKGNLTVQYNFLSSYVSFLYADPHYIGYMSNSIRLNSGLSMSLSKFNISVGVNVNRTNMAIDTLFSNMPYSRNYNLSLGYRLSQQSVITLGAYMNGSEDISPTPLFNYDKYNGRFSLQTGMGSFRLALQGDYGTMINRLKEERISNYGSSLNTSFDFASKFSLNSYVNYLGGEQGVTGYEQFYYGGSLLFRGGNRFSMTLNYNSNFEWKYYTSDRSLLSLNLTTRLFKNHELNLNVNQNLKKNTLNKKECNVQLRYAYILNFPVSIRKDVGSVSGSFVNHGVAKVGGIRLNLNGIVVLTDKEGRFRFPAVPVGAAILGIDASSLGLNTIVENPGPYKVNIEPGKTTVIELALTKSAVIAGQLIIKEDTRANQKGFISVKDQLTPLIIEVSNKSEVYRVFSNADGGFRFNDLRPGSWQVKIYTNNLPSGYQIETTQYDVELTPGDTKEIEFSVSKKARQIQFQKF